MISSPFRFLLAGFALFGVFQSANAAQPFIATSPDRSVSVAVSVNDSGRLTYAVARNQKTVIPPSPMGITVDGNDLGAGAKLGTATATDLDETYPARGVHATAVNRCRVVSVPVTSGSNAWTLEFRVFNDGAAYRYRVPGKGKRRINGEASAWKLPATSAVWFQDNINCYEGLFTQKQADQLEVGHTVGLPVTVELPDDGGYALLTEANLIHYSELTAKVTPEHALEAFFHADAEGWETSGEILTPWRVTLVSKDLNGLVNSDIVHNLCPPPNQAMTEAKWVQPGRVAWQWWSVGAPKFEEQKQWVDWTKQLGFEYYLVDEGWKKWKDGTKSQWECLKGVVDDARSKGVKVVLWVHSKEVFQPEERAAYFAEAKKAGVVGLKIDFMPPASAVWVDWYEAVLREAADLQFVIDFHGAVKPTGRDRTWPNEVSREAIRGHEWHILRYKRTLPPEHDTVLPFNRFVVGHGDYTPTVFNPAELRGYTWARELAQAIVFTSPFLCYADRPDFYLKNEAAGVLKSIPSVWDETVVLPGSKIGSVVGFARRSGKDWFIGVINASEPCNFPIALSFLGEGRFQIDQWGDSPERPDGWSHRQITGGRNDSIPLALGKGGGFVMRITQ